MTQTTLAHLRALEAEAIHIMREVAASYQNPGLFYSIGKDSTVLLHLARKAFYPGRIPFTLLHVDTGWEFAEMAQFRDEIAQRLQLKLEVHINREAVEQGIHPITSGSVAYNDAMKTQALKQALARLKFDAAIGGARRDEEQSRAKERIFSVRDKNQVWDPKNQRPELWNVYNTTLRAGESVRVFPLSNWTELDIWLYILRENIDIVSLYFAKPRLSWICESSGQIFAMDDERMLPFLTPAERESLEERSIRFRTLGCYPQTGATPSMATSVSDIIQELLLSRTSEREGRTIDKDQAGSMERKKRSGYF
ncbi:sulfate adenylyltransferase subunit CysD [Pseudohongiella sp. SYSU M77423]|uniref:sulfate adenylyltransferase subunit CysD n=1 Tax=Pseudohongiella sp. SYSU M77423 TaxID=3042312 RepID=UPI0024807398|nr:sulfate adenylyltransferase subunit CysD [Pseudohongiella sp. SYSU M77423]MDH7943839.1 sulfate adenylyltransferase subunit CysD [Pseudohongiella sp. SYSU M77423]MEC8861293.1 sulfate adenylyltransferase subunit CysD [Pseudomonadota bacterium]